MDSWWCPGPVFTKNNCLNVAHINYLNIYIWHKAITHLVTAQQYTEYHLGYLGQKTRAILFQFIGSFHKLFFSG